MQNVRPSACLPQVCSRWVRINKGSTEDVKTKKITTGTKTNLVNCQFREFFLVYVLGYMWSVLIMMSITFVAE